MKKMKKLLSMLLAVVMVLAMAAPSFAAEGEGTNGTAKVGKITIDNPIAKETDANGNVIEYYNYRAYKIFDVTYDKNNNDDSTTWAYSIEETSPWFEVVSNYSVTEGETSVNKVVVIDDPTIQSDIPAGTEIVLTKVASENRYAATFNNLNAANFAKYLRGNKLDDAPFEPFTTDEGKKTISASVDLGYYFVTSDAKTNALCNLTSTDPDTIIHDKNDIPFDKTDDKESVEIGEVVNYTYEATVPDTTGFNEYDYIITDTMSNGLTFNNDIKVYVDNAKLDTTKYEVKLNGEPSNLINGNVSATFELKIDVMKLKDKITKPIHVTYSATVNDAAVKSIEVNKAVLSFSNDPTDYTKHETLTDEETVYSAEIVVDKYETGDDSKKLSGAQFVLKNASGAFYRYIKAGEALLNADGTPQKNGEEVILAEKNIVIWVDSQEHATVKETNTVIVDGEEKQGYAQFPGLKDGIYNLVEIKAPNGYNLLDHEVEIEIDGKNATADDLSSLSHKEGIANATGTLLPSTGGIGTTIFYAAGIILMAGAVFFIVRRKRA